MSDVEVTYAEPMTRKQTARMLSTLATALADAGHVELELGATRMSVRVPGEVRGKVEVEIHESEVEFEVELRWSIAPEKTPPATNEADDSSARPAQRRKAGAS